MLVAFVSTISIFALITNHNGQATNSTNNKQTEMVSSTGLREKNPIKKEPAKKELAANSQNAGSTTSNVANRIGEVIGNMIKVAVCAFLIVMFRKLPKEQQKSILKGFRAIVMIFLSIVSLGVFMGVRTWNNDR